LEAFDSDAFWSFCGEFSPCAAKSAKGFDEHERTDCVYDAFVKIFELAQYRLLPELTGAYVHGEVYLEAHRRRSLQKRRPN
jgi:hypothetical protein